MKIKLFGRINQTTVSPLGEFENGDVQLSCFVQTRNVKRGQNPHPHASDEDIDRQYAVFAFAVPRSDWQRIAGFDAQPFDLRWFDIVLETGVHGPEITVLGDGDLPEVPFHLVKAAPVSEVQELSLNNLVAAPFRGRGASEAEIRHLIDKALSSASELDASVVDVGQASLVALHGVGEWPSMYFDLGWPTNNNLGRPPKVRPALRDDGALVILSHWDWDHWGLARKKNGWSKVKNCWRISWDDIALNRPWIVPGVGNAWGGVQICPLDWRLALALSRKKRFYRWPAMLNDLHLDRLSIYRPSGGKRGDVNQHGLVVVVDNLAANERIGTKPRAMLFPGDADYVHLPFMKADAALKYRFSGLAATHHGADFTRSSIPLPDFPAVLAYSVGRGNSYSHPVKSAQIAYLNAGWDVHAHTTNPVRRSGAGGHCVNDGGVLLSTQTNRVLPGTGSGAFWLGKQ